MGGVTLQAGERAVEVAGRGAPTRELLDHVKVVLLHLVLHLVRIRFEIMNKSYFAIGAGDNLPLLHDEDILARL